MALSMTVVVELHGGEILTLSNVNAKLINEIEEAMAEKEYNELEIRNMDNPKKSIEFFLSDVKEVRFENGT